jgi:hypothetical protein
MEIIMASPKELAAENEALKKELAKLTEQNTGLLKRLEEMQKSKPASKSRQQAEQGLEMLKAGPVTKEQFATLNPKYPSDVAYYIKNTLKIDVKTVRTASGTVYMLPEQYQKYQEGLAAEKAKQQAAKADVKAEAKESPRQAPAQVSPALAAGTAKAETRAAVAL